MTSQLANSSAVTFIGALPPPVTGRTAMTAAIVDALERRGPVRRFDWSRGKPIKGWRWRLARNWGALKSLAALLVRGRAHGAKLYYAVSSSAGLYYDIGIATAARLLGYRMVLHHHNYAYIDRFDWRIAVLDRLAGTGGAHAVHCQLMEDDFRRQYRPRASFLIVPPTIVSQMLEAVPERSPGPFTVGFMSNLTIAKGLDDALQTFEALVAQGRDVRFLLAGPCMGTTERTMIDEARARYPKQVEYRGPVYGAEKAQFFADIDVFLFPTRNESWGIVLTESLAAGRPVVARSKGCVPWIIRDGCGTAVDSSDDFVAVATKLVCQWIDAPETHRQACDAARGRSNALVEEADRELPKFVDQVLSLGCS